MDNFDPYAEPKFDFEQTNSPPAPNRKGNAATSRREFQDFDPHVTLSFNGLSGARPLEKFILELYHRHPQGNYRVQFVSSFPWPDHNLKSFSRGRDTHHLVCSTRVPSRYLHSEEEVRYARVPVTSSHLEQVYLWGRKSYRRGTRASQSFSLPLDT